jgi:formylglycine-generating enzyme
MAFIARLAAASTLTFLCAACGGAPEHSAAANICLMDEATYGLFVDLPAGKFEKGAAPHYPEEHPTLTLHVMAFSILAHEVTNEQFSEFVAATGYLTDAERHPASAMRAHGSAVFRYADAAMTDAAPWQLVAGATWRAPGGPGTDIQGLGRYPVVHVSRNDARAYARWADARLPSEVEWEYAASIGLQDAANPVSGAYDASGTPVANTWQGFFPFTNSAADGFVETAPAGCFPPSTVGLYDMIGNVWEWTETAFADEDSIGTIKGGSFLCADNHCRRYRPAARQPQAGDFSASHIGFRVVRDLRIRH